MKLSEVKVLVRGAGEVASAIAHKLHRSHFKVCMTEISQPLAVSRGASFCEAIYEGKMTVEGVTAFLIHSYEEVFTMWDQGNIPLIIDPQMEIKDWLKPDVLVDAIMAKRNTGVSIADSPFVIGVGPGFCAGRDVHVVVETNNSENLGKVIFKGEPEPDTGIPLEVGQITSERAMFAPVEGIFRASRRMGDMIKSGDNVGWVNDKPVTAQIDGVLRAVLRDKVFVKKGMKLGEVDPRGEVWLVNAIRPRMRTIAGGVLEAIMNRYNV